MLPVPSAVPRRTRPAPSIHTYMLPATTAPPFIYLNINLSLGIAADSGSASPAPSRGKPPRLSRRFKQNHCHRRRHSAARAASRRRRGRMQSSHAPIERGSERASIGAKCVAVRPASRCPSRLCLHEIKSLIQGNDRARQRRRKEGESGDSGEPRGER